MSDNLSPDALPIVAVLDEMERWGNHTEQCAQWDDLDNIACSCGATELFEMIGVARTALALLDAKASAPHGQP